VRRLLTAVGLVAVTQLAACKGAALAYGANVAAARTAFDDLAGALEARFTNVVRGPKFAYARLRIARYAFAPSKLVNDTAIWTDTRTTRTGPARDLELRAGLAGNQFTFVASRGVATPTHTGDQRHLIALEQLGEDDWFWHTEVDHAVGAMAPARATEVFRALLAAAERPGSAIRADYRAAFPRTTQALGRLIRIDTMLTQAASDGSTLVMMRLTIDGTTLGRTFPAFGKYVRQYIEPARYRFRLSSDGADWLDAQGADRTLTIQFRSHDGQLRPLAGGMRVMPDTVTLTVDAKAKFGIFTVGVSAMKGEFVFVNNTPRERAWAMRFNTEPQWHLPLIAERLLRSPLRRPFEGRGVVFRLGLRSGADGQTLLNRTFDVAVRESAIMRFLGNLGFTAVSDYAGKVEEEENRFIAEAMRAMRADAAGLK
jgi:hypothetical protein